jgi:hypothetical protein
MLVGAAVGAVTGLVGVNFAHDDDDAVFVAARSTVAAAVGGVYGGLWPVTLPATALVLAARAVHASVCPPKESRRVLR